MFFKHRYGDVIGYPCIYVH